MNPFLSRFIISSSTFLLNKIFRIRRKIFTYNVFIKISLVSARQKSVVRDFQWVDYISFFWPFSSRWFLPFQVSLLVEVFYVKLWPTYTPGQIEEMRIKLLVLAKSKSNDPKIDWKYLFKSDYLWFTHWQHCNLIVLRLGKWYIKKARVLWIQPFS